MSGASPFNSFIQVEMPKRPYLSEDVEQETIIIRRGVGPRQLDALKLAEGETLIYEGGQLKAVKADSLTKGVALYHHNQDVAATEWLIDHGLTTQNFFVQCYGADNKLLMPSSVEKVDADTLKVVIPDAVTGYVEILGFNGTTP